MPTAREDRWQHLVSGAFRLDETPTERLSQEARGYLHSILEVFPEGLDPVEDFEAYAVRRMATALLRALDSSERG